MNIPAPIHITLIDDDDDDCYLFKEAVKECPTQIILKTLCNGEDAMTELAALPQPKPDIIFLDINMPKKSGKEILTEIRGNDMFKNTAVIMFSTSTHKDDVDYAFEHGANLFIPKSLFFEETQKVWKKLFCDKWEKYLHQISRDNFLLDSKMLNHSYISG